MLSRRATAEQRDFDGVPQSLLDGSRVAFEE
jgi:hypothetical protein